MNTIYEAGDILYRKRNHFCSLCKKKLQVVERTKVIGSHSLERKLHTTIAGDIAMRGDIEFIWNEFYCSSCDQYFSEAKMKYWEKKYKALYKALCAEYKKEAQKK